MISNGHWSHQCADGDGFGAGASVQARSAPPGYVTNNEDCRDTNPRALPGQTRFYNVHRRDGSFDFNCDGVEALLYRYVHFDCGGFSVGTGWLAPPIPSCGQRGYLAASYDFYCREIGHEYQRCR